MAVKQLLIVLMLLYLLVLHTSMAGMELFAWIITICAFGYQIGWRKNFEIFKHNRALNLWILAMGLAVAAGLLANPLYRPFSVQFGFMRWAIVLYGLVFALQEIWSEQFERRLLIVWAVLVAITGSYAWFQCVTGIDLIRNEVIQAQQGGIFRATGWFSASLTFAYSFGISLFAMSLPTYQCFGRRVAVIFVIGALGVISPVARGAWLAGSGTVLVYLLFTKKWWTAPLTAAGFYGVSKFLTTFSSGFGGKIEGMATMQVDHSSSVRLDLWKAYWNMFVDHPWFGVGLEQGDKFLPDYFAKLGIHQEFYSHAHNNLLQFLGGAGIFGLITYCGLNAVIFFKAWRLRKVTPWGWSILLAQVYLQLGGLTEVNFHDGEVTHMFVFTWAILLVLENRQRK